MTFLAATLTLLLVMDPVGNVPLWLVQLERVEPASRRRWVAVRECLIAGGVLLVFWAAGPELLRVLGVDGPALPVAGGVVIFLIALRMVFPVRHGAGPFGDEDEGEGEPLVVPLAIPLFAGPSAMATITLLGSTGTLGSWPLLGAIAVAWGVSLAILVSATRFSKWLGRRGLIAVERLMGMLLTIIAVDMIMEGVRLYLGVRG